ncbi:helix-turn-helix transcriptional regulator [Streptomyces acidiscabies]|uniref:helix-turn-helix domain-containing protein n=1 Tax=Streptomyces acidiscabies TaxID=42234 RepID=UPI0030CD1ABB
MGRRKVPLTDSAPYYELASWLRSLRRGAGLTYREMACRVERPGCSAVTLSRADSGRVLPRRCVVEAYATACGASEQQARAMWELSVPSGGERPHRVFASTTVPRRGRRLDLVYEPAHLLEAMHRLRDDAGHPSLRRLQDRARAHGYGPLPRSTLSDVLSGLRLPSEALLTSYVLACGQPPHRVHAWRAAWQRAQGVGEVGAEAVA